jgi:putative heme-binding domain-containing protein
VKLIFFLRVLKWALLLIAAMCFAQQAQEIGLGRGMFRIHCSACHGIRAQGGRGPDLTRGVFAFGDRDEDLAQTIANGIPGTEMSGFEEQLSGENIRRVVAFIRSVNQRDAGPLPGDSVQGEILFWDKGNCGWCHRVGRRGGNLGPDLTHAGRQRSLAYLRESIVAPNADITPGYATIRVVTRDGKVITGTEKGFDNFTVQLIDPGGKFYSFDKNKVTSVKRETRSLMPDNYGKRFSEEELTNLLAYLANLHATQGGR